MAHCHCIELPVLAFTQGRVSVNWCEVSRQPGRFDHQVLILFITLQLISHQLTLTLPWVKARPGSSMAVGQTFPSSRAIKRERVCYVRLSSKPPLTS